MKLSDLNETMLAPFYEHLKEYDVKARSTIDRHTRIMRSFLNFLQNRGMYSGANLFKSKKTSAIKPNPISITDSEFSKILESITEENGWGIKGTKRNKNYYRKWLPELLILARHTGIRREELFDLKWSSLVTLPNGRQYFCVKDFKISRQKKEDIYKPVPVTKKVKEILESLPKISDNVIPTEFHSLGAFNDFISRAFSHFYGVAISKNIKKTFKQLRKSQMTDIKSILGDKAYLASGHTSNAILDAHYIDRVEMVIKMLELEENVT